MKNLTLRFYIVLFLLGNVGISFAQLAGITSGTTYIIKSKANNKVLDVTNSSLDYNARVKSWAKTNSDAQRWIITFVSDSTYYMTNVASKIYIHITNTPKDSVNIDQYSKTSNSYYKWIFADAGDGSFYIKPAVNSAFSLNMNTSDLTEGPNVHLLKWTQEDKQKWVLEPILTQGIAPSAAIADTMFNAWKVYHNVLADKGFWSTAEMLEIIDDAYEVTGNPKYKQMFTQLYNVFISAHGEDWMGNDFNDDITWMVLACVREGINSNTTKYVAKAKDQFDKMYARAIHTGDWLTWKQGNPGTNSCINGPAMVACCYLASATGDSSYYNKAIAMYNWSKNKLFIPATGKVNDNYNNGTIGDWSSTYNQGTYLGAAVMLYNYTKQASYLAEAIKIANYTKTNMFNSGIINGESGNDLEGFKGIFMRYARRYTIDCNKTDLISWLQLNAKIAYNNRNSKNLTSTLWGNRTSENITFNAFNSSTAVSLLINCPLSTVLKKDAFEIIEAENFNYLKNVNVEACPEGTNNLTNIYSGYYTGYNNVNFGTKTSGSVQFRVSSLNATASIEIHLSGPTGKLIGTATVTNTGSLSTYTDISCPIETTTGLQNIYLVFRGTGLLCNINNFKFIEGTYSDIKENTLANNIKLKIYPNPVNTELNVSCGDQIIESLTISDLNGKILLTHSEKKSIVNKLDVSELPKGVYIISVTTAQKQLFIKKLIK